MKKKTAHRVRHAKHVHHTAVRRVAGSDNYLVLVRGWMFVVAFALMLGVGVIVGNFLNNQLESANPQVAGYTTELQ